jgi:hypothetical protein
MRHADSLLALNAFFVFVVEASFRDRSSERSKKRNSRLRRGRVPVV